MYLTPLQLEAVKKGTYAERPESSTPGTLYYTTDSQELYLYTSQGWILPATAPAIVTSLVATNSGSGRALNNGRTSVSFTQPTTAGVATTYTAVATPVAGGSPITATGSASPIVITGLASNASYTYYVSASNSYGQTLSITTSGVIATTLPAVPVINSITPIFEGATVAATVGATGGAATTYTVVSNPVTTTRTASSFPYNFTGLTVGTAYTFTVTATNANGSTQSNTSTAVTIPNVYALGSRGPGGGWVFYDAGSTLSWGRYLEVATPTATIPWTNMNYYSKWSGNLSTAFTGGYDNWGGSLGTAFGIGTGWQNTTNAINDTLGNTPNKMITYCRAYAGGGFTNWSLASIDEITAIKRYRETNAAFDGYYYDWEHPHGSSTERPNYRPSFYALMGDSQDYYTNTNKDDGSYPVCVRAFS